MAAPVVNRDDRQAFVKTLRFPVIVFDRNSDLRCTLKDEHDAQLLVDYSGDELDWQLLPANRPVT